MVGSKVHPLVLVESVFSYSLFQLLVERRNDSVRAFDVIFNNLIVEMRPTGLVGYPGIGKNSADDKYPEERK